ncbi:MAG: hypothetical protein D3924_11145 [Candidatus Electrothrix sp. AR4]|nr:hypothetical protein [Candidatus Electrothrix sp. AR4]
MNILITGTGGQLGQDCLQVMRDEHTVHGRTSQQLDITQARQVQHEVETVRPVHPRYPLLFCRSFGHG